MSTRHRGWGWLTRENLLQKESDKTQQGENKGPGPAGMLGFSAAQHACAEVDACWVFLHRPLARPRNDAEAGDFAAVQKVFSQARAPSCVLAGRATRHQHSWAFLVAPSLRHPTPLQGEFPPRDGEQVSCKMPGLMGVVVNPGWEEG